MKKARSIVSDTVKEIEERVRLMPVDESLLQAIEKREKELDDRISEDFSRGLTRKHVSRIRKMLGSDFLDFLHQGKIGPLGWIWKDRLVGVYQKLALLLERYLFYRSEAREKAHEVGRLMKIKQELIDSQVSHVHEVEMLEGYVQENRILMDIVLDPFEDAMKKVMSFLKVKHLEVFLFDDDRFLATEMKIDGETLTYNQEEERPEIPESVSEVKLQEVKETTLDVPLFVEGKQIGHYRIERQASGDFDTEKWKMDVERMTPVLARIIESNRNQILARKVYIDDLTGIYNKRKLSEQMGKLFKQFKRGDKELHIVMMDIDKFKPLNDTHGHPVGDEILKQTAVILKEEMPFAYRYGGEEFAGVFYGYDKTGTMTIMENLRKRIEKTRYDIKGQGFHITISVGIARFETYMHSVMDAIDRADKALYASKEDGRNRCTYYDDVKDRLSADAAKLRQDKLQLQEQLKMFQGENMRLQELVKKKREKVRKEKTA